MDPSVSRERRNLVSARVPSRFNWPVPRFVGDLEGERHSAVKSGDGEVCAQSPDNDIVLYGIKASDVTKSVLMT